MSDYYKDELLKYAETWPIDGIDVHIKALEVRLEETKEYIRALRAIRKRKMNRQNVKETGTRGGM